MRNRSTLVAALALFSFCSAGVALAQNANALLQELNSAYQAKNYDKAIEIANKLIEIAPKDPAHPYNLACCLALKGDADAAKKSLAKAIELGFRDASLMESDADLVSIRDSAEFKAALEGAKKNSSGALSDIKKKAAEQKPLIIAPPNLDASKPAPLIIALHGFGGTAAAFADEWKKVAADNGAILMAPQALNTAGAGYQWGNVDEADAVVMAALEYAMKNHKIDPAKVVISGFSQGGMVTYAVAMRHPDKFCGAVPICGLWTNVTPPAKGPKFFIMVGGEDQGLSSNKEAAASLEKAGYSANLAVYPGVGHALPSNRDEELAKALKFIMTK